MEMETGRRRTVSRPAFRGWRLMCETVRRSSLVAALGDVIDRLLHGCDLLGILIRDLRLELLFECHHQLDRVERVGAEVVDEGSVVRDFLLFHPQLLGDDRSEEHTSELQSRENLVCRLLLEKKKKGRSR